MTARKKTDAVETAAEPAAAAEPERPRAGGSYVRQPDGTLVRQAFTADAPAPAAVDEAGDAGDAGDTGDIQTPADAGRAEG